MSQALSTRGSAMVFGPGVLLAGRYELIRSLGRGGVGEVWLARNIRVDKLVAIKTVHPSRAKDERVRARFKGEALAANRTSHPNIVQIFDADQTPDGRLFLVMEYVEGKNLHELQRDHGCFELEHAYTIIRAVAVAVAAAHSVQIIHRDLKPENVMISGPLDDPAIKVMDFGIAANLARGVAGTAGADRLTSPGTRLGTPHYMAPEQGGSTEPDPRLDVYSLGVMLFEMLTGALPFDAADPVQLLALKIAKPAPPLASMTMSEIPAEVSLLVDATLSTDPRARPPSAEVFVATLDAAMTVVRARGGTASTRSSAALQGPTPVMVGAARVATSPQTHAQVPAAISGHAPVGPAASPRGSMVSEHHDTHIGGSGRSIAAALLIGLLAIAATIAWMLDARTPQGDPQSTAQVQVQAEPDPPDSGPTAAVEPPEPALVEDSARTSDDALPDPAPAPADPTGPVAETPTQTKGEIKSKTKTKAEAETKAETKAETTTQDVPLPPVATPPAGADCLRVEARANDARNAHDWTALLRYARKRSCFKSQNNRVKLLTKAYFELKRFGECAKAGGSSSDSEVQRWVKVCQARASG